MKRTTFLLAVPMLVLWSVPTVRADDDPPPSYTKDVKPFMAKYCVNCHMGDKPKAGIALDTYEGLTKNAKKKVIVPGKPTMSLVLLSMQSKGEKKMPPKKEKTQPTAAEIDKIKAWITAGAKDDTPSAMLPLWNDDALLAVIGRREAAECCLEE